MHNPVYLGLPDEMLKIASRKFKGPNYLKNSLVDCLVIGI